MKETGSTKSKRINFNKFGYYDLGLLALAILGFWPTQNSLMAQLTSDTSFS